jgi:hypothetical protein
MRCLRSIIHSPHKRRADILSTPQFAEVVRYAMAFPNPEDIIALLWDIADGPQLAQDLIVIRNYVRLLGMDVAMRRQPDDDQRRDGQ